MMRNKKAGHLRSGSRTLPFGSRLVVSSAIDHGRRHWFLLFKGAEEHAVGRLAGWFDSILSASTADR